MTAANWYVSSVAYTAVTQWAASTVTTVGTIVRQLATPAANAERCFRCSAVSSDAKTGSVEPTWTLTNSGTTTDNHVTWIECTGQEAHQHDNGVTNTWTAPAARIENVGGSSGGSKNIVSGGDTMYLSSDHAQTLSANAVWTLAPGTVFTQNRAISVSRTGSVPPVAADIATGASLTHTGTVSFSINGGSGLWQGITFTGFSGQSTNNAVMGVNQTSGASQTFKNCTFVHGSSGTGCFIQLGPTGTTRTVFDNTTVQVTATGTQVKILGRFEWKNTASAVQGGTLPTNLLIGGTNGVGNFTAHGVDFSALGSGKNLCLGNDSTLSIFRFNGCKLGASVTVIGAASTITQSTYAELINCDSGATGYRNEWHSSLGDITTETTITRTNGATDGTQKVSHKFVTNGNSTVWNPLESPIYSIWNPKTTGSVTAVIEFISSATLKNDDIWMELEYLGSSGTPIFSYIDDTVATVLTGNANQTSSASGWDSSPSTPQTQKMTVTFSPVIAGNVRAVVKLAKASTTVYVDPKITLS